MAYSEPALASARTPCVLRPFLTSRPIIGTTDSSNVALHGVLQDLLGARMDHPLEVVAVDPIERERHQRRPDGTDGPFGKGDKVRNAAHEREGLTVQVRDSDVRRAHHAFALGSRRPMQHRSAGEVSAPVDQRDTFQQFEPLALPELDAAVWLPHPLGIAGVEMDGHIPERSAPIDQRRVEVRMRNGDGAQSAKPIDQGDRGVIDQRDAIPQDVPFRRTQEQCALPDGEFWLGADADEAGLVLAEPVVVRNPQPCQRCPRLPLGRDELALVFAHGAVSWRSFTWRILGTAGRADECRHDLPRLIADTHGTAQPKGAGQLAALG